MTDTNRVGHKIRELREAKGLTLAELAARSQTSEAFITELEQGEPTPSIAPLVKIARALEAPLGAFLDDAPKPGPAVVRAGVKEAAVTFSGLGPHCLSTLEFFPLAANKQGRHMEPFVIAVHPSAAEECNLSFHEGEEFIYVLEGVIEVNYGDQTITLEAGDSIYYDSTTPHEVRAGGDQEAKILAVVFT